MTRHRTPRTAAVLAAALNSWAATTRDNTQQIARLELRQAPTWSYTGKIALTEGQVVRLLDVLREDLVPPRPNTPVQAAAAVDQILAEWRAAGRTLVRPRDLIDQLPRIAQPKAWLAAHLTALVDDGFLRETRRPGTYRL
jgi:hypothetical protein